MILPYCFVKVNIAEKLPNGQTAKQKHWYFVWQVRNQGKYPAAASQK